MQGVPSDSNQWVGLLGPFVFCPLWLVGMGTFAYFFVHVAPLALQRWADEEGYQIIQRKNPGFLDWRFLASSSGRKRIYGRIYRVIVRDKIGQSREGLILVGSSWWYSVSVSRCRAEVRWDRAKPLSPPTSHPDNVHLLWDRELG
jgi:hypothetical protein